jgi:predicted RNase H-like HicB family nuclease
LARDGKRRVKVLLYRIKGEEVGMTLKYVHWQDGNMFLGYLQDYPDYMTQGETEEELRENLIDIYKDITDGLIKKVRKVDDLVVSA